MKWDKELCNITVAQNYKKVNAVTRTTFAGVLEKEPRPVMIKH